MIFSGVVFVLALLCAAPPAHSSAENAGEAHYDFLYIGAGARPLGLGGAYTAAAGDPYALYWNPAGIAGVTRPVLMADYMHYVLDMQRGMPAAVAEVKRFFPLPGTVGAYLHYFDAGRFEAADEEGERLPDEDFGAGYYEGGLAWGERFPDILGYSFSAGATVKGLISRIADYRSTGAGLDIGVQGSDPSRTFRFGAVVKNLNLEPGDPEGAKMPMLFAAGLQYHSRAWRKAQLFVDWNKPRYGVYTLRFGEEYRWSKDLQLRAGYRLVENELVHWYRKIAGKEDPGYVRDNFNHFSFGLGLKLMRHAQLDLAAVPTAFQGFPLVQLSLLYTLR